MRVGILADVTHVTLLRARDGPLSTGALCDVGTQHACVGEDEKECVHETTHLPEPVDHTSAWPLLLCVDTRYNTTTIIFISFMLSTLLH